MASDKAKPATTGLKGTAGLPAAAVIAIGAILGGCTAPSARRTTLPSRYLVQRPPLVFHTDFPLASQHRLLEELIARRNDVLQALDLPGSNEPIHVYLFDDAAEFNAYVRTRHPEFPGRRAYFLETDTRLVVYAQWGDRVAEDLRHEVTHAYLHAVVPNLPLWLDEGLAEYFETPRGRRGLNLEHLHLLAARLRHRDWIPDLRRLEALPEKLDLSLPDYAEAWAWVHLLLQSTPERRRLLQDYLRELRQNGWAEPVSVRLARLVPLPRQALIDHVENLIARFSPGALPAGNQRSGPVTHHQRGQLEADKG